MGKESLVVGGVLCLWEVENSSWVIFWLCRVGKGGGGGYFHVRRGNDFYWRDCFFDLTIFTSV